MAENQVNFDDLVRDYNLTSDEMSTVKTYYEHDNPDKEGLAKYIAKMREENAVATSKKDVTEIPYDELQVAWGAVKNAKEGEPLEAKKALQDKSEALLSQVKEENVDMTNAGELAEWLEINNSLNSKDNAERNKALGARLKSVYAQYDKENGLEKLTPAQAEEIVKTNEALSKQFAGFDPFESDNPAFVNVKDFYNKLNIDNSDKSVDEVNKEQYMHDMAELAKREAISQLSTNAEFLKLPADKQSEMFAQVYAGCMEQGAVSIIVNETMKKLSDEQRNDPNVKNEVEQASAEAFANMAQSDAVTVSNTAALGAYEGRAQAQTIYDKRIGQKIGKRGFWGKIKDKKKAFEQKHPKIAVVAKVVGSMALTTGVNMAFGGAGLAVLGAYKTYQAVKKANEERVAANANASAENKQSLISFLVHNPRHLISITSNVASVALAGWSASAGLDANGLVGQSMKHGAGQAFDNMGQAMSNFGHHLTPSGIKDMFGDHSVTNHSFGERVGGLFKTDNALRFSRTLRTLGVAAANFGVDMAEMAKADNKGKRKKMFLNALLKAGATAGLVFATTPTENAEVAPTETAHNDTPQEPQPQPEQVEEKAPIVHRSAVHHSHPHIEHHAAPTPMPEPAVDEQPIEPEPQPGLQPEPQPESQPEPQPEPQETRDEAYYNDEKESLTKGEDHKSLKQEINLSRKSEDNSVEDTVDSYMDKRVAEGDLSEQQATETANLVKHELDGRDGNQDGQIDDDNLSKGSVRRAMKEVDKTLEAMRDNADEIDTARNMETTMEVDHSAGVPETYSTDTKEAKFYNGMTVATQEMLNQGNNKDVLSEAMQSGNLSEQQVMAINLRHSELREQGLSHKQALKQMLKDFERMGKYQDAQNFSFGHSKTEELESGESKGQAPADKENAQSKEETQKHESTPAQENTQNGAQAKEEPLQRLTAESVKNDINNRIDAEATVGLQDAEKMANSTYRVELDKSGNRQIIGKDENGEVFKITEVRNLPPKPGERLDIHVDRLDVSKDSELYAKMHPNVSGLNHHDKLSAETQAAFAEMERSKHIRDGIASGKFHEVGAHGSETQQRLTEAKTRMTTSKTVVNQPEERSTVKAKVEVKSKVIDDVYRFNDRGR